MKKVMLIYPPGLFYQRCEDRCQINVEASVANSLRACNDLGYASAILKKEGYSVFLKDYPAEKLTLQDLKNDVKNYNPDVIFISITNGSIYNDINVIKELKEINNNITFILKGALFFNPDDELFSEIDLSNIDYVIGGETEFIISPLLNSHFGDKSELKNIQGISYKENDKWISNKVTDFYEDLDSIPFPDRAAMNNDLYINPYTNRKMATISTSRGCPSSCIYCLSPAISGKKVRYRSPKSVFDEINECVNKFGIYDFFFKSDTFTINKTWAIELCNLIINSDLSGRINWVANSRVNTLDDELLEKMKKAGCSVIALGIESGSDDSLKKMKKGTTVEQNINAVNLIKKHKLKSYGFYLIGFPWETDKHIEETKNLIFKLDTDFIEVSIATPFKGSELYKMVYKNINDGKDVLGKDSFKYSTIGTDFLSREYLEKTRKDIILKYHIRPSFIIKKIFNKHLTFGVFCNYIKYGLRILKNIH